MTTDQMKPGLKLATALATVIVAATLTGKASAGTLTVDASFNANEQRVTCPPGVPTDGTGCTHVTGTARIPGLGLTSLDELVSYLNGPQKIIGSGTLSPGSRGTISYSLSGDARTASYLVTGGTGDYVGATGSGTIHGPVSYTGDSGAFVLSLSGNITAPATNFDTTPPRVAVGKAVVKRSGVRYRIRLPLQASDNDGLPLSYSLTVSGGTKIVKKAGSAQGAILFSVRASRRVRSLRATLAVYDTNGNATTRSLRIALPG